jgi:septal ring factor EnvC (AmiA/AmiB activator)
MDDIQKFTELKKQIGNLSDRKIRIEERHKAERAKLETLIKEITSKGYDPQKLSSIREEKEKQLKTMLSELEIATKETTDKLNLIEA